MADAQLLDPFNLRVIDQIRRVDQTTLAFYEPWVVFDFGADTALADTGDPNAGLSFHDYCLPGGLGAGTLPAQGDACGVEEGLPFQNAEDHIAATGDTSLLTEFSATNDEATNDRLVEHGRRRDGRLADLALLRVRRPHDPGRRGRPIHRHRCDEGSARATT